MPERFVIVLNQQFKVLIALIYNCTLFTINILQAQSPASFMYSNVNYL